MSKKSVPKGTKFEDAMQKLEQFSEMLSNESISLEESINVYEEGLAYYEYCKAILDDTTQRIVTIEEGREKIR